MSRLIDRQAAIDALWKALYEYEDKTEKQFIESDKLDVADWFQHRIFVQNMSDIDRQALLDLPSAQPERRWVLCSKRLPETEVLCCDTKGEIIIGCPHSDEASITEFSAENDNAYMIDCIAWMPLPEPYKAKSEE